MDSRFRNHLRLGESLREWMTPKESPTMMMGSVALNEMWFSRAFFLDLYFNSEILKTAAFLPGNNGLAADWVVFVNTEIEHVNSPIPSAGPDDSAGVCRPTDVRHLILQLEHKQSGRHVLPPDLDGHLSAAGEEDVGDEMIPLQTSHRRTVSRETEKQKRNIFLFCCR